MKLSDKLIELRKSKGWSQEDFAEKLDVSRQAISRWENGSALPDAQNILRISKLFCVTADYLLNDDYKGEVAASLAEVIPEEAPTTDAPTENAAVEVVPVPTKKNRLPYLLIPAICFVALAICVAVVLIMHFNAPDNNAAHEHTLATLKENEVLPTCTADGSYDEVLYCTACNEALLRTSKSIQRLAHTLSSSTIENEIAATCTASGSYDEVIYCSVCNEVVMRTSRSTEKIAHQFQNKKCTVCNEILPSEGLLYMSNGDGTCFSSGESCTDEIVMIPSYSPDGDKVTQIKAYAFAGHSKIKSVYIPETVTLIGEGAFEECTSLESINLPSALTMIHAYTFKGCASLSKITIPANVYYIGMEAFANCRVLDNIVIPAKVSKIAKFAFMNCGSYSGTLTFERYDGWKMYDDAENLVDYVDFQNTQSSPMQLLTVRFANYHWRRG